MRVFQNSVAEFHLPASPLSPRAATTFGLPSNVVASVVRGTVLRGNSAGSALLKVTFRDKSVSVPVFVVDTVRGDFDADGDVDISDVKTLQDVLNTKVFPPDARDLNGDGRIDALDVRILTTLCRRARCAVE